MLLDAFDGLNWLAVIVATVAYFIWGGIWYAQPVMGRQWMRAAKIQMPEGFRPPPIIFVVTFVAYFLTALAMALIAGSIGAGSVGDAIVLGVITSIGFQVAAFIVGQVYEQRSGQLTWINGVYSLIGLTIVALIVTLWD